MNEIWRDIDGYGGDYQVSNLGRVRSFKYKQPRILKLTVLKNGYPSVHLQHNNKRKLVYIHRLVAEAFIPNPDNKPQVNHIDGNKLNNHADNLEWVTRVENMRHATETGLSRIDGENNHNSRLTNEQAVYIRDNPDKLSCTELARLFSIGIPAIIRVQRGERYKTVGGNIRTEKLPNPQRIPDEIRQQIRAEYKPGVRGHGHRALAKKFGIHRNTILRIVNET